MSQIDLKFIKSPVVESKSANFTAAYKKIYLTTGAIDVQLPAPISGECIRIKKTDDSSVNVLQSGSESIEGVAATYVLASTRESALFVNNGTNWYLI